MKEYNGFKEDSLERSPNLVQNNPMQHRVIGDAVALSGLPSIDP
ncbi:hypothetical protein PPTG_23852 [Phytophthora nicotianae INRA-310]|uniref:Uncharacterized protein n=1 Tax=Phytophthora nicotianae (strain INRA-310) TaxID=761204 RepID=W2PPS5_PHYN3|nr:hypothetical protein PPTG_23852 [Phytophthora nicotianae INRA-310]ETN02862.1 hypothetical protein PPTG_23852 [Phytophthora nicotianae INRA-310]